MEGCCSVPIPESKLREIVPWAKDYAFSHGITIRTKENPSGDVVTHAPFTILPSPVPRRCFQEAIDVQQDFNLLMHRVAHDYDFLKDCLKSTIEVDDFTRHMWEIYETVRQEGVAQPISLGLNRSDYMFDCHLSPQQMNETKVDVSCLNVRQIEFNTMASSFGGLSCQLSLLHRAVLNQLNIPVTDDQMPENRAVTGLAEGFVSAWMAYGNPEAVVLFLVDEEERNIYDQRLLEYAILETHKGVKVIRRTFKDLNERAFLTSNKLLEIDGLEVAVVYMRTGYTPMSYKSEKEWASRLMMERSCAIKCPSIHYHLAGTKKVQQMLANEGAVEKFLPDDPEAVQRIRNTFAGQYTLDKGEDGDKHIAEAMVHPEHYVLKPQREGGGNNTFGDDIRELLGKIKDTSERSAYILMDRIYPTPLHNHAVRSGEQEVFSTMVSELGVFGILVGTEDSIIINKQEGFILRTKVAGVEEGGVATGYSALDSPYLI